MDRKRVYHEENKKELANIHPLVDVANASRVC
jgi:hypothetical protein